MKRSMTWGGALLAALLASAAPAAAQADRQCDGADSGAFSDALGLARVTGKDKTHFVLSSEPDKPDCPGPDPKCRARPYLMAGDVVVTSPKALPGFVCASYVNRKGIATHGWLPAGRLAPVPAKAAGDAAWTGRWQRAEASIRITRTKGGALTAEGEATWGAGDPRRVASGGVNTGDFAGDVRVTGDVGLVADADIASFEAAPEDRCVVRLRAIGPYLLAEDNRACGGLNVSFGGLYVRR